MKTLIAILMTASVFANTYVLTDLVTAKTDRAYQPQTEITLHNLNLVKADIFERKAVFTAELNGEKREFVASIDKRVQNGSIKNYTLTGTFQNDVLSNDACDEYEAFSYRYQISLFEVANRRSLLLKKLSLYHSYSWDQCHDRTQVVEFPYSQK